MSAYDWAAMATIAERSASLLARAEAAEARVAELESGLRGFLAPILSALASLAAAISLLENGGRRAAPSDKMYLIMLKDYNRALDAGREAFHEARRLLGEEE
jgi:hypothetical protein